MPTFLTAAGDPAAQGSVLSLLMPFALMFVLFYFLLIRPQQRQQKKRQEMLNNLKKGDKVITVGGLHGEIVNFKGDDVTLRIADKVEVKMIKGGISRVKGPEQP